MNLVKMAKNATIKMMKSSSFPLGFVATLTKTEWNGVISSSVLCVSRLSE